MRECRCELQSAAADSRSGYFACDCSDGKAGYIGSLGYETQDADAFASWGADYLKVSKSLRRTHC